MLQKFIYAILTYLFLFFLAYAFASRDQRQSIVQIMIYLLEAGLIGFVGFVSVALFRWLFKDREYQPNENGDFPIIRSGGLLTKRQYINLNAIGTSYSPGQEMSLKDFQALALHRLTSGKFGSPPASIFNNVNPFNQPQLDIPDMSSLPTLLPAKVIDPNEPAPPILLEARNIAQEL